MANGQKTSNTGRAGYLKEGGSVGDVTPCHYGCATSTGCLVTQFTSQSRQPSFANNVTGTAHFNCVTGERN